MKPLEHRPEPHFWKLRKEAGIFVETRLLVCRFCGLDIQRRGLFRRWVHVTTLTTKKVT